MPLTGIRALVAEDLAAVDQLIEHRLRSEVALIDRVGHYIVNSGGKRLRPVLVLLAARACGVDDRRHLDLAAVIEFIHTATLLHDDVVDGSQLRRGRQTANAVWGNETAVLVGDFLYSRAFQMMVEIGDPRIMAIMAETTNTIAEGEVLQLINTGDAETTEERYLAVIRRKTAKLFEAGARCAAVLAGQPEPVERALTEYGMCLGSAFQLIDDALDYGSSGSDTGKNIGDDLAEGKPTLPLIHAMRNGTPEQAATIRKAIKDGGLDRIDAVLEAIESTGAIAYTARLAREEAERAAASLAALPPSPYRGALEDLAAFSVSRSY
jgi:octaprenyl-diphosphate synthase